MRKSVCVFAAAALVALALPAQAGFITTSANNFGNLVQNSQFGFSTVSGEISFGNIRQELDRANTPADLHGVYGTQYNRVLGGVLEGDDRPTTLFTALSAGSDEDLFQAGVTGPAGEGGAYAVTFLYDNNQFTDFSDFGGGTTDQTVNESDVQQIALSYGRFVNDTFWLAGKLYATEDSSENVDTFVSGTFLGIDTSEFSDEGYGIDLQAKLLGDNHALAFGIGYGMADLDNTFVEFEDDDGTIDTFSQGLMAERTSINGWIRYSEKVSDTMEWEVFAGIDMHEGELRDPVLFRDTFGTTVDTQVATNDNVDIMSYNVRGTLLHRVHENVDMYYTFFYGTSDTDVELDTEFRTDDVAGSAQSERVNETNDAYGFNLAARYFFTKRTALTFGAQWIAFDNETEERSSFEFLGGALGGPSASFNRFGNENTDTDYRVALSHVLSDRFRFDVGFYGSTSLGDVNAIGVYSDEFRASVTASF